MLMPSRDIGSSAPHTSDSGSCLPLQLALSVSQIPEKSGLPSGVRGEGADRLGFPSAVLGTPAVGYFNHWAKTVVERLRAAATTAAITVDLIMDARITCSRLKVSF